LVPEHRRPQARGVALNAQNESSDTPQASAADHAAKENSMGIQREPPQTFVEAVLALLEERFPWLGSEHAKPVSGADTVDGLSDLYRSLVKERDKSSREDAEPEK
jgi:hypothetical protein